MLCCVDSDNEGAKMGGSVTVAPRNNIIVVLCSSCGSSKKRDVLLSDAALDPRGIIYKCEEAYEARDKDERELVVLQLLKEGMASNLLPEKAND